MRAARDPGKRRVAVALGGLLAFAGLRLLLATRVGLGDDEAYYWHWAQRLDWSYFDHPGMVAWLIAASTALWGDTPGAVRLPTWSLSLLTSGFLAAATLEIRGDGGRRGAAGPVLWALLLTQVPLLFVLASVFAAPDAPMLTAWAGATWLSLRALERGQPRLWVAVGGLLGLGLLSKHTAVLLGLGVLLALLVHPAGRRQLRTPWPAVGAALALLLWAPVLAWNLDQQGASFRFHLGGRPGDAPGWMGPVALFGSQLLMVGPAGVALLAGWRAPRPARAALAGLGLPVLLVFAVTSPRVVPMMHWLAPAWLVCVPPAALWCGTRPRLAAALLGFSGVPSVLLLLQAGTGLLPLPPQQDPTTDLVGWATVAEAVRDAESALGDAETAVVVAGRYQVAGQAAWALRDAPTPVTRVTGRDDQYTLWTAPPLQDHVALVVEHDRYPFDPGAAGFRNCEPPRTVEVTRRQRVVRTAKVHTCRGYLTPK